MFVWLVYESDGVRSPQTTVRRYEAMRGTGAAAYGMYSCNVALSEVVSSLNRAGFDKQDICMVLSPAHPVSEVVRDTRIDGVESEDRALVTIGWVSEFGAVVIPTVGVFIRSQAFLRVLLTERKQTSQSCGSGTTLQDLGFPEREASRLSHEISDIGALVYVACPEGSRADKATELLRCAGACEAAAMSGASTAAAAAA